MDNEQLKSLYKKLDNAVSEKNISVLEEAVLNSIKSDDVREKRAVYQYASLFRSEVPEVKDLEEQLKKEN